MLLSNSVCRKRWKGLQTVTHCRKNWRQRRKRRGKLKQNQRGSRQDSTILQPNKWRALQLECILGILLPRALVGLQLGTKLGPTICQQCRDIGLDRDSWVKWLMRVWWRSLTLLGLGTKSGHRNKGAFTNSRSVSIK